MDLAQVACGSCSFPLGRPVLGAPMYLPEPFAQLVHFFLADAQQPEKSSRIAEADDSELATPGKIFRINGQQEGQLEQNTQ